MRHIVAIDIGEDNPLLLGPFNHEYDAAVQGKDIHDRWGNDYEVFPVFTTYGEFLRYKEGLPT